MGLFGGFRSFAKRLGMLRLDAAHEEIKEPTGARRARVFETVEPRIMLNGIGIFDPIEVGAVYIEGDTGSDGAGDTIEVTFNGGGPETQLDRVIISGDKAFDYDAFLADEAAGAATLKNLDVFFDTISTGDPGDNFGKDLGSPFQLIDATGIDNYNVQVVDGTSLLILNFQGFDAGEKFVFNIDVDQVIDLSEVPVSEGLDAITSGVEFQNSTLAVEFTAPGFKDANATGKFKDSYNRFLVDRTLDLTPDDGRDPTTTIRDRTAGVAFDVEQDPLPITIAGTVFHDRDLDLVQDRSLDPAVDEHGIDGVELQLWKLNNDTGLYEDTGHRETTAGGGHYEFGEDLDLLPGTYEVREGDAAGYYDVGAIPGQVNGSDVGERGETDPPPFTTAGEYDRHYNVLTRIEIPLGGQQGVNYDFAEAKLAEVSGFVYHDRNDNGLKETGEEGIGGVRMLIQPVDWPLPETGIVVDPIDYGPGNGRVTAIVTTNPDGSYKFDNMRPGTYRVIQLDQPNGFNDGKETAGKVDGDDVGTAINPLEPGRIEDIVLVSDSVGVEYNFGEHKPASIHGSVCLSTPDGDCFGEDPTQHRPVVGARVELWNADGTQLLQTTFTDDNGDYSFTNLAIGTYRVREYTPSDLLDGDEHVGEVQGVGTVGAITGDDATVGYDEISGITLLSDQTGVHYDFCEHVPASISGYVYHDINDDGVKDPHPLVAPAGTNEPGISGVTMTLVDTTTNQVVATTTTDDTGFYRFDNLHKGTYRVVEGDPGAMWTDGKDRAGFVRDANGVAQTRGTAVELDTIQNINLLYGDDGQRYDFGEIKLAAIHGRVHLSTPDGDCFGDDPAQQRPVVGAKVELWNADGTELLETTFTDDSGDYWFMNLRPGEYIVREYTPDELIDGGEHVGEVSGVGIVGAVTGDDATVGYDEISGIVLASGQTGERYDFCEHEPAKISGFVYHDRDNDGVKETGEEGIGGVTMSLIDLDTGSVIATTTTDAGTGMYMFGDLLVGNYKVQEGDPGPQWIDGIDTEGTILRSGVVLNRTDTSDVGDEMEPDMIVDISLLNGDKGENYNFGEYLPGSISGYVFVHPNGECLLEPGQTPSDALEGITIELLDANGTVIQTTQTLADGSYRFDLLPPGTYSVREGETAGYFDGDESVGYRTLNTGFEIGPGNDLIDDELRGILIGSGDAMVHYNFCEAPPASISGYVFQDGEDIFSPDGTLPANVEALRDGLRTSDDTPISGVTLELRYTLGGDAVQAGDTLPGTYSSGPVRTTTNSDGYYEFTGLRAGNYTVVQIHPSGYFDHLDTAGTRNGIPTGVAINRTSDLNPAIFNTWPTQPPLDTIALIGLPAGSKSIENNFSEVQVFTIPIIPPPETPEPPPPVVVAPPIVLPQPLIVPTFTPFIPTAQPELVPQIAYTWHLSVIDAGEPREAGAEGNGAFFTASSQIHVTAWDGNGANNGTWELAGIDEESAFGLEGAIPIAGDFNGDGVDEIGVYLDGEWYIDLNANGIWDDEDLWAKLGEQEDRPVVGDWDGDGKDDIGIFGPIWPRDPIAIRHDPGLPDQQNPHIGKPKNLPPQIEEATDGTRAMQRSERGTVRRDLIDHVFLYGQANDVPVSGDWNGDGITAIGTFNSGYWQLDSDGDGRFTERDQSAKFGLPGDRPVVGDFNGDGVDELGVYRAGTWIMDTNGNREIDAADKVFELGGAEDLPVAGDWDGDGTDEPAVYRSGRPERVAAQPKS